LYPPENESLFERIAASGAVLSEFPLDFEPFPENFPRRNRLVSGLSAAVVVVEATEKSGSLTTAGHALEQGREVMAVPGPINSRMSYGSNKLIQQGAKAVICAADVFEEIGLAGSLGDIGRDLSTPAPRVPPIDLSGLQLALWNRMTAEPQQVDALVAAAETQPADVLGALTELELRGLVRQTPGMVFGLV
jgi:DNA processing protein